MGYLTYIIFQLGLVSMVNLLPPVVFFSILEKPAEIPVKAIYVTANSAGSTGKFTELVDLVRRTELNAVVIDVKDYTGRIFLDIDFPMANEIGSFQLKINSLQSRVSDLKKLGIYTIARIAVFQDPYLAEKKHGLAVKSDSGELWRDYKGLAWVDASRREVWDYNIAVAKSAAEIGFDEVNFDYVRFPSDGNLSEVRYDFEESGQTKNQVMGAFFTYLGRKMRYMPVRSSVDLFGMTLWRDDGLGIGQRFSDAVGNFDYIYPMLYPSHFPNNFEGYPNPSEYTYEIVYNSLDKGNKLLTGRKTKIRPWVQDFNLGAVYDSEKIRKQIQAAYDKGSDGWLLWNASNRYTEDALQIE